MFTTLIGALIANVATGAAGSNLCADSILVSAYDKGYNSGVKFYNENAGNSQKQQDKIRSIATDINGQTVSDPAEGIAFCTQLGYADALVIKSQFPSASFLAYFNDQVRDRVCASLRSKNISAGCAPKIDSVGLSKDLGRAEKVEVDLVGGSVQVLISNDEKVHLTIASSANNSQIESANSGEKIVISENIEGSSGDGNTRIILSVPRGINLKLKSISGEIIVQGVPQDLKVDTVSGDIRVKFDDKNLVGKSNIDSVRGNIYLSYANGFKYLGKIKSVNGSVYGMPSFNENARYVLRSGNVSGNIYINQ